MWDKLKTWGKTPKEYTNTDLVSRILTDVILLLVVIGILG